MKDVSTLTKLDTQLNKFVMPSFLSLTFYIISCDLILFTFQVSIDQSVVDLDIPFRLGGFASTTIQLLGIVGVMTNVTWQIMLLVVPMAIACLWMQVISLLP